jgi:hypothetical protein
MTFVIKPVAVFDDMAMGRGNDPVCFMHGREAAFQHVIGPSMTFVTEWEICLPIIVRTFRTGIVFERLGLGSPGTVAHSMGA